jgi:hypothetical protein
MHRKAIAHLLSGFLLLIPVSLALTPSVVSAQPKPGDAAALKEAERLGKEGEKLLEKRDAQGAIDPLAKAYALSNNPRFLLPLGLAYAEAERPLDALDALGRFLKDSPTVPDAKRKEIGTRFAVMLDQVAALVTLEASRQNAPVKVDGRPVGTTPLPAPLRLMPGKHEIVMQPAPTDPSSGAKVIIEVRPGERKNVKLEPGPASRFLEPQASAPTSDGETAQKAVASTASGSQPSRAFYEKWPFWAAVGGGAAAVLAIGLGAGLATRNSGNAPTPEEFPSVSTWPGGPIDGRPAALVAAARLSL